jgi:glycine dehydrogenase
MKTDSFALRHLGPRENDLPNMLETIGVETLDQLIYETIPADIRLKESFGIGAHYDRVRICNIH